MSERQLPEDYRSRIQQGFAASLLLTFLLFSGFWWLQMSLQEVADALYRGWGGLSLKHLAAGPCRPITWRQVPCRPSSWRQAPRPPGFRIFTLAFLHLASCRQVLG